MIICTHAHAYVIQGSSSEPVLNGNIVTADSQAREKALLDALKNYFSILKANQPNKEIPDVTEEFFKFIRSYKIAERAYVNDNIVYTVLADVDDIALNDLMYFVKNVVNSMVYNISGISQDVDADSSMAEAFKEYKFDLKYQSDFQANLPENSTESERNTAFRNGKPQYFMDMSVVREDAQDGSCSIELTTRTYSKTKEFQTLKTKSSAEAENENECMQTALKLALLKTLTYVRSNFIPLPEGHTTLNTFSVTAEQYTNFADPKKVMDALQSRSFIESYKIKSFAGNKLEIEVSTYVSLDILIKKLQSLESEYGFSAASGENDNILLDFSH